MNPMKVRSLAAGAALVLAALVAGCGPAAAPGPAGSTSTAPPSSVGGPGSAGPAPASSSPAVVTPTPLPPEAQMETDRLLILAAKANDPVRVRELIAAGGNVNAKDDIQ